MARLSQNVIRCNRCFAEVPAGTAAENEAWKQWHLASAHPERVQVSI